MSSSTGPVPTEAEAIEAAGRIFAAADAACARMTPREQAEAAWSPTSRFSVDELEDRIRARRGMTPLDRTPAATSNSSTPDVARRAS